MKEPRNHLPRDLEALRYLDALDACDLEAVAALWDEASRDPQLERRLTEFDRALFVAGAGANRKDDAESVWGLAPKHRPSGHRTSQPPTTQRRWAVGVGAIGSMAAACLLAVFAWSGRIGKNPVERPREPARQVEVPRPTTSESPFQAAPRTSYDNDRLAAWRQYRRALDGGEMPAFNWPLQGDVAQLGISLDSSQTARWNEQNRPL
jgi:hypothetical protein